MNRFSRYSCISPLELCLASERLAWRCAFALLLLFVALAAAALICPAPEACALSGSARDFTGIHVQAPAFVPRREIPSMPQPPVPEVFSLELDLPHAVAVQIQTMPLIEWDGVEYEESPLLELELPEALSQPVAPPRTASSAGGRKESSDANAAAAGELIAASYRSIPRPPYPASMLNRRAQGRVGVKIAVDAGGIPLRVEVISSSGYAALDRCAREWVLKHWRFYPARRGGVAVASVVRTQVEFVLR